MDILRNIKHWQIFLVVVGLPFLIQLISNVGMIISGQAYDGAKPGFQDLILILPLLVYYGWIGAVGTEFSKNNPSVPMPVTRFHFSLWTSVLVSTFLFVHFWIYPTLNPEAGALPLIMIGVLLFVALFTLLYSLSFMARSIVQLERKRRVNSAEFYSEFVMAVVFPIGIWLLQPRINRLNQAF